MTIANNQGPGFEEVLGLQLTEAGPDEVRGTLTVNAHLLQPYGITHGGVLCSMIETAASYGGALWFAATGADGHVVGVSNHTNFLRATKDGDELTVTATPLHRGRTQQLWQAEVVRADGRRIATGQVRLANVTEAASLGLG